jgi:hypothetical protein
MNKSVLTLAFIIPVLMLACQNNQTTVLTEESNIQESNMQAAQNSPDNLLRNGEFESADAWNLYPGASLEAGQGKTGRALKAGGAWSGARQAVQVKPNTAHTIYGLVRSLNGQNCTIAFKGGGSKDWNETPGSSANTWTLVAKVVTTPATVTWAQVLVSGSGCLFDDIILVPRITNPRIEPPYSTLTGYPNGVTVYKIATFGIDTFVADIRKTASQYEAKCNSEAASYLSLVNDVRASVNAEKMTLATSETGDSCRSIGVYVKQKAEVGVQSVTLLNKICNKKGIQISVSKDSEIVNFSCY